MQNIWQACPTQQQPGSAAWQLQEIEWQLMPEVFHLAASRLGTPLVDQSEALTGPTILTALVYPISEENRNPPTTAPGSWGGGVSSLQ